jgi:predicted ATPase
MALSEPETSLHPSLIPALARLIARASASSQIIIVTHASQLIDALGKHADCHFIELEQIIRRIGDCRRQRNESPALALALALAAALRKPSASLAL